jgi:heme-degrading monooxygenase HmoA
MKMSKALVCSVALSVVAGCGTTTPPPDAATSMSDASSPGLCSHEGPLESDIAFDGPPGMTSPTPVFFGPGADMDGALVARPPAAGWVVASTYLRLNPDNLGVFGERAGAVVETLFTSPGLVAMSTSRSDSCGTVRTLTIWESEEAMLDFVGSPAHMAAIGATPLISRGGSVTAHWMASTVEEASWTEVESRIRADEGPFY